MTDRIAKAKLEGFNAYYTLKKWFNEPERANIYKGYYSKCYIDAWKRGFLLALRTDVERFKFLMRIEE